VTEFL